MVRLDPVTLQWHVVALATVTGGAVELAAPGEGAYAAVEGDAAPLAPPPAVAGAVLGSAAAPDGEALLAATLRLRSRAGFALAAQRGHGAYQVAGQVGSGLPLTLRIREN